MLEILAMFVIMLGMVFALFLGLVPIFNFVLIVGIMIAVFLFGNQNGWLSLIAGSGMIYILYLI